MSIPNASHVVRVMRKGTSCGKVYVEANRIFNYGIKNKLKTSNHRKKIFEIIRISTSKDFTNYTTVLNLMLAENIHTLISLYSQKST